PRPRVRVARHRAPRLAARGGHVHPDHRAPTGPDDRVPRGDRPRPRLDRRRAAARAGRGAGQDRLRRLSEGPAEHARGPAMKVTRTKLQGVFVIDPDVFSDARGFFLETWSHRRYSEAGMPHTFVQDNLSRSARGILRGLHLQHPFGQGKLVQVMHGEVYDVAVDVRVGSPTFGQWVGTTLTADNHRQVYIPPGFAHGFCVVSEHALFSYKCTEAYHRETE